MKSVPPSVVMREELEADLRAGAAGPPLRQVVARAAQLMLHVGLEEPVAAFFGRAPYERHPDAPAGHRNGYGWHAVKSEAGPLTVRPPKVRGTAEPFGLRWPTGPDRTTPELAALATHAYVRGVSDRNVEDLYAAVFGGRVSKSAVSRAAARLQADFDRWRTRDLSALKVVSLFLDGQFHAARQGSREQEGILAAYAIGEDGRAVLLHLALGPRESTDAWTACLHDLTARGLGQPLLIITDGSPGLTRAVRAVFPGVPRPHGQVHTLRNILAKLPRLAQRELKPLVLQVFQAPDLRTALRRGRALLTRFRARFPSAMECLEKDLEECLTYLRFPVAHRRRLRTTNLLERTFGESRRRTKVIPRFPGERSCLTLVFAALITASAKWRGVPMTPPLLRQLDALRAELTAARPPEVAAA